MIELLQLAADQGDIRPLDLEIGLFLEQQNRTKSSELLLAATLASAAVADGHVCLPLDRADMLLSKQNPGIIPTPESWRKTLLTSPVVGQPGETTPLILDRKNRLYLYRFFHCEKRVADSLQSRAIAVTKVDTDMGRQLLAKLFPKQEKGKPPSDQLTATALSLLKPMLIISGGPGTGKTWTVARILALLQAMAEKPLRIGLAAPTGKAAARLQQSLLQAEKNIDLKPANRSTLQTQTLHRLLGYRPRPDDFRWNEDNPLHLDLLVIDEASMIDLALMDALLRALPPACRLILLGDRYQLASVEAGSLFSDLCAGDTGSWSPELCAELHKLTGQATRPPSQPAPTINEAVVTLHESFRFHNKSGIGTLALAVNSGRQEEVETCLAGELPDLQVHYLSGSNREQWLKKQIIRGYRAMLNAKNVEDAFAAMETFHILCAIRKGPAGVEGINILAEQVLAEAGLISRNMELYQGKPIIIRRNQYQMRLFNGDSGILWADETGRLKAWFMQADNRLHPFTPARLPENEAAWAITIHKAQGSEFAKVLLLLPEGDNRILGRELLYTGITRAKKQLILCGDSALLSTAVTRKTRRYSGLADQLQSTYTPKKM